MQYRPLGNTGLNVSTLSFGASSLGGVFRNVDESEAIRTVPAAIDGGINLIDVSPFYGLTKAETVLGKALKDIPRDRYYLSTKCGRYGFEMHEFDFSAQRITRSIDESLARLGVDHVDILLAHDVEFGDLGQIVEETIPAMLKLKEAGKTRFVGFSALPLKPFQDIIPRVGHDLDVILSYCHYEMNDTALLDILSLLDGAGIGAINASPLGMGLLSNRGVPDWHPAPPEVVACCKKAAEHCAARGVDIAKLAVQFAVAEPRIPTTLVGTANPDNIRKNIAWADEPIDAELLRQVLDILRPIHNITWPSGRPENN
jgi:aryl-alcohol dehydrogenase-like predicted oxidoreductase